MNRAEECGMKAYKLRPHLPHAGGGGGLLYGTDTTQESNIQ